jgi:DNA-binding transcriptional ArsR family regulator
MNKFVKHHSDVGLEMIEFTKRHGAAMALLNFLVRHMKRNNSVLVSNTALAEILGMSLSSVNKNIRILKDNKLITSVRTGNASIFYVNKAVISCAKHGDIKYYQLDTTVILSSKEERVAVERMEVREKLNDFEINNK